MSTIGGDTLTISNLDMLAGAAETSFTIPERTIDIRIRADGGYVLVASESGGDPFKIADGDTLKLEGRTGKHVLYFTGQDADGVDSEDVDVQILRFEGMLT